MAEAGDQISQSEIDETNAKEKERLEIQSSLTQNKPPNIGSLLRLFKSEFFDPWIGISYLFKYRTRGVHDYLCEQLFSFSDDDIEFYLAELWYIFASIKIIITIFLTTNFFGKFKCNVNLPRFWNKRIRNIYFIK